QRFDGHSVRSGTAALLPRARGEKAITMGALLFLLIATFQPPRPTIGDPVTITFAAPTTVDPSADYEVISRRGNTVVIRTFVPHTITVKGHAAAGPVSVMSPIHSVLKPDGKLEPAPLHPPRPAP